MKAIPLTCVTAMLLAGSTTSFAGCNLQTQDIAGCINPPGAQIAPAKRVTLEDLRRSKEGFEQNEAVKLTKEFHEWFDKINEPFEKFDELYSQVVDAQTGRDPWKLREAPSWLTDPVGRLTFERAESYATVGKSIATFELPPNMFDFRTDWAKYPAFYRDWSACDFKALDAVTYDLGKIEIALASLSDYEERLSQKADELRDITEFWNGFVLPLLENASAFSPEFLDHDTKPDFLVAMLRVRSNILPPLADMKRIIERKMLAAEVARRSLLARRASLASAMAGFEASCAATQSPASDVTGIKPSPSLPYQPGGTQKISRPKF